ncbi:hypothetical protein [Streptomyces sp. NPDC048436]|uniref:hypothetical protein n=1 Tax=Streptomyces sp. NPDC048436 TaxID=3365550 RepID=UPI003719E191
MTSLPRGGAANRHSSPRRRRAVAALGAVSAGLLVLSACDKPTPLATITVGKDSVHSDATCYDDGDDIGRAKATKCALKKASKSITLHQGDTLRIGVDPEVAKTGWTLWVNGQQANNPSKKTYYAFEGIDLFAPQQGQPAPDKLYVSIVEQDKTGQKYKGVWNFQLKNGDA